MAVIVTQLAGVDINQVDAPEWRRVVRVGIQG